MLKNLIKDMNRVKITAPTYQEQVALSYMKSIFLNKKNLDFEQRFGVFKNFADMYENIAEKQDVKDLLNEVTIFRKEQKNLGIKVSDLLSESTKVQKTTKSIVFETLLNFMFIIPFLLFFLPLRLILITIAESKRVSALNNSVVKGIH